MPRERVAPQSEVIGVIVLEDSPYCVQHQRAARTAGAVGAEATAGARKRRQSEGREREDEVPPPLTYSPMSTAEPCAWLSNTNSLRRTGGRRPEWLSAVLLERITPSGSRAVD